MITKRKKSQKGQSLLYVSILIIILISSVFFVYDVGSIVNTKIKLQNGVDSAVLGSVAVKISKHHNDSLIRAAMFNESLAAQAQQRAAQALFVSMILDMEKKIAETPVNVGPGVPGMPPGQIVIPGQPGGVSGPQTLVPDESQKKGAKEYKRLVNLTYKHVIKMHRERKALEAYYEWLVGKPGTMLSGVGREAITEVARIGFRTNANGLLKNAKNLSILTNQEDVFDNQQKFTNIGGDAYGGEGATQKGNFGKSFIEVYGEGVHNSQGFSLLKYANKYTLTTNAAAKVVSSDDMKMPRAKLRSKLGGVVAIPFPPAEMEMNWYSPRLMSITRNDFRKVIH